MLLENVDKLSDVDDPPPAQSGLHFLPQCGGAEVGKPFMQEALILVHLLLIVSQREVGFGAPPLLDHQRPVVLPCRLLLGVVVTKGHLI